MPELSDVISKAQEVVWWNPVAKYQDGGAYKIIGDWGAGILIVALLKKLITNEGHKL